MAVAFSTRFPPGTTVSMKESDTKGVVTKINIQPKKRGNPFAPSSITVEVATNSPVGIIKIPLTQFDQFERSDFDPQDHFFADSNTRERRTIMTGNLVYPLSKQYDGQIVNFTDKKGAEHVGFLMPWHYDSGIDVLSDTEFELKDPVPALEIIKDKGKLESKDGLSLSYDGSRYTMQFPKSNLTSNMRKFKSSWEPRMMGFDFHTIPSQPYYEAKVNEEQAIKIVRKMRDRGMFFTLPETDRQSYVDAGGPKRACLLYTSPSPRDS